MTGCYDVNLVGSQTCPQDMYVTLTLKHFLPVSFNLIRSASETRLIESTILNSKGHTIPETTFKQSKVSRQN